MTSDVLIEQGAVNHVLEEEVFLLAGEFLSGQDAPVQRTKKFLIARADWEPFDQYTVDLIISGRIIISRPVPFKVLNAGCPDLHRNSPLMKVLYGSPGLGFSPSRDIQPIPGADKGDFHFDSSGLFSLFGLFSVRRKARGMSHKYFYLHPLPKSSCLMPSDYLYPNTA
jgi:hypothetical protein